MARSRTEPNEDDRARVAVSSVTETSGAEGLEQGPVGVQSTTTVTPSKADESSSPGPYQGDGAPKSEDPPVRAAKPDTPIAQSLVAGAGQHTPPDPDEFGPDGRPVNNDEAAE